MEPPNAFTHTHIFPDSITKKNKEKSKYLALNRKSVFFLLISLLAINCHSLLSAQPVIKLNLPSALDIASKNNQLIISAKINQEIAEELVKETKEERQPDIDFHASYGRITNITEYRHGLGDKIVTKTIPDIADLTASAKMPLYTGGRIKYSIIKTEQQKELADLQLEKVTNDISIEVVATFLRIYRMMELQKLITDHIKEEEDRLREVKSFKAHGTVTKNEVLRAELQLSDMQLSLMTNQRNIAIATHDLKTILQLPESDDLEIDTADILKKSLPADAYEMYESAATQKDEMRMASREEEIRKTEKRIAKSNYFPNVHFFASYGFNYPNYMFFPPDPYLYTLGKVGVEVTYSLSGLYKNKTRMQLANRKIAAQLVQTELVKNKISDRLFKEYTQYQDIKNKIPVTEKAVETAAENYRIIKVKYLNQLALITDMVDADNTLLEARFNNVSTRIDAVMKYHELLHASGLLLQWYKDR